MQTSLCVGFAGEVDSPCVVARCGFGFGVFYIATQDLDFVIVTLQYLVNISFADGNFSCGSKAAVAGVSDGAASGLGHAGFEMNNFLFEPVELLRGVTVVVFVDWDNAFATIVRTMWHAHFLHEALEWRPN